MKTEMIDISLEYALGKLAPSVIDKILSEELSGAEKAQVLLGLDEERKRQILKKMGFKAEYLKTI